MEKKQGAFRTTIGGQALIEGILMRGPEKDAIVVRSPEGLVTKVTERKFIKDRYPILGIPILRGAVTFISSMITGVKALMFSADYFPDDEDAKPSKFDQWLEKHIPAEKLQSLIVAFSVILSLGLTLALFMLLPTFIAGLFHAQSAAVHNIIEGVVKVLVFLTYLILCSKQKDVHRVFCYHGAEHKTIFCYEAGLPLTVENARIQPRHHPRCGTSFLFVVIVVSIQQQRKPQGKHQGHAHQHALELFRRHMLLQPCIQLGGLGGRIVGEVVRREHQGLDALDHRVQAVLYCGGSREDLLTHGKTRKERNLPYLHRRPGSH